MKNAKNRFKPVFPVLPISDYGPIDSKCIFMTKVKFGVKIISVT